MYAIEALLKEENAERSEVVAQDLLPSIASNDAETVLAVRKSELKVKPT